MAYIWLWLGLVAVLLWTMLVFQVDSLLIGTLRAMLRDEDDLLWFDDLVRNLAYYGSVFGGYLGLESNQAVVFTVIWFFVAMVFSRVLRNARKVILAAQGD